MSTPLNCGVSGSIDRPFSDAQLALSKALEAMQKCPRLTMAERDLALLYAGQIQDAIWSTDWVRDDGSVV